MNFTGGLIKDTHLLEMPESSWRNARNVVQDIDKNIVNENGFDLIDVLDSGFKVIGTISVGDSAIIFSVNDYIGEIGLLTTTYTRIIRDAGILTGGVVKNSFKFSLDHPIEGTYYYNYKNELIIVWTDNYNPVRLLNVTTLNKVVVDGSKIYNDTGGEELTEFNLFYTFRYGVTPAEVRIETVDGTYSHITEDKEQSITIIPFIRLLDKTNTYTKWFGGYDTVTIKSDSNIKILNPSPTYALDAQAYQIGFAYYLDGVLKFDIVYQSFEPYDILNGIVLKYNNALVSGLPIIDVLMLRNSFDKCKTLTQVDDRLICANIEQIDIGYQKYANNILTSWGTTTTRITDYSKFSNYIFCPDEVYALYIHFILKDGRETLGYHIPGRIAVGTETNSAGSVNGKTVKSFHINDTSILGSPNKLSYWENETEIYPTIGDDIEVWEENPSSPGVGRQKVSGEITLSGKKVRHHKIPTLKTTDGYAVRLNIYNVFIPDNIKEYISGYYISYANRDKHKTILGFSLVTNETFYNAGTTEYDYFCHPIDLMIEQAKVDMDYIKRAYRYDNTNHDIANSDNINFPVAGTVTFNVTGINTITEYAYIPRDNDILGNIGSDAKLAFKGASGFVTNFASINGSYTICSIHSIDKDVFVPFNAQQLIPTGVIASILRRSNRETVSITKGDTFLTNTGASTFKEIYYTKFGCQIQFVCAMYYPTLKYATNCKFDTVTYENDLYTIEIGLTTDVKDILDEEYGEDNYNDDFLKAAIAKAKWSLDRLLYFTNYPALNYIKGLTAYTFGSEFISVFKNRLVRSIVNSKESKEINWRKFLANEYYELQRDKGEIEAIQGYLTNLILHTEYGTFVAKNKDVLLTNNVEAYLGKADILDRTPEIFIDIIEGYAGCKHQFGRLITKYGYVYVDALTGKIFLLSTDIKEISNTGISKLLKLIIKQVDGDNPYKEDGVIFGYDREYERLLCTIISSDGAVGYTLSYSLINDYWVAFHDYIPNYYVNTSKGLYSIKTYTRSGIYINNEHGDTIKGIYYYPTHDIPPPTRTVYESYIEPVFLYDKEIRKMLHSVTWQSAIMSPVNREYLELLTITDIAIYSLSHYTGIKVLRDTTTGIDNQTTDRLLNIMYSTKRNGLYRFAEGQWFFNDIRDALIHNITINKAIQSETRFIDDFGTLNNTQINALGTTFERDYFNKHLFLDRVFAVRLIYDNVEQYILILHNVNAEIAESVR